MKRIFLILLIFALLFGFAQFAVAKKLDNNIEIASGVTVHGKSGSSIYVIDMRGVSIDPFVYAWDSTSTSPFSIQLSAVTCAWIQPGCTTPVVLSGATINFEVAESNYLPIGASRNTWISDTAFPSSLFQWRGVIENLAHYTGNTKYVYPYALRRCRYQLIRVTSGLTSQAFTAIVELP